jgi:hypothetical protein
VVIAIEPKYDTAASFSEGLALVSLGSGQERRWKYIDTTGKMVIEGQANWYLAGPFSEGLAPVGILNSGSFMISPEPSLESIPSEFTSVKTFEEWLQQVARVPEAVLKKIENDFTKGNKSLRYQYDVKKSENFMNGRSIRDENESYFQETYRLKSLAALSAFSHSRWGYIDREGRWAIAPEWDVARPFHDGIAIVSKRRNLTNSELEASYDTNSFGKWSPATARMIEPFSGQRLLGEQKHEVSQKELERLARLFGGDALFLSNLHRSSSDACISREKPKGFAPMLPTHLFLELPHNYQALNRSLHISDFSEGFATVTWGDDLSNVERKLSRQNDLAIDAVIDTSMKFMIAPRTDIRLGRVIKGQIVYANKGIGEWRTYKGRGPLSTSFWEWKIKPGLIGLMDMTGQTVVPPKGQSGINEKYLWGYAAADQLDDLLLKSLGLQASTNDQPSDALLMQDKWEETRPFSEGLAAVKHDGKWGFINHQGKPITKFIWRNVGQFKEGMAAVQLDHRWGYVKMEKSQH